MKIFKAFILGAAVEGSALNQERVRRQGDIDWNFINSNSNGNTVGNGEIFRINKYIASVYVSDRYARTELALAVKNNDLVNNQKYNFAVNLKDDEFISGLTMRIGQNEQFQLEMFTRNLLLLKFLQRNIVIFRLT